MGFCSINTALSGSQVAKASQKLSHSLSLPLSSIIILIYSLKVESQYRDVLNDNTSGFTKPASDILQFAIARLPNQGERQHEAKASLRPPI